MMTMLRTITILGLLTAAAHGADRPIVNADRPNVVVIFSDDHGYSDLTCQGIQTDLKTPNLDALAAGGARMTSGYVTAPQCVPSRAGLLSGRSQNRFGVESNGTPLEGFDAQLTIAERLQQAGYATGMTGKWHLGSPEHIVDHGFDDVYYKNANRPGWANFHLDGSDREPGAEDSSLYHLDANSAAASAFIKRHHNEPFFFYCAYRAPHVPLDAPQKYLDRFPGEMPERRRQALAMIAAMDDGVGLILQTLREFQIEERTLIFFIGDNGAPLKIHKLDTPGGGPGWDGSLNDPLNGEKGMLSEGGIRVPFVAYWKGRIAGGMQYDHPVVSLDVAATAVAIAGLPHDAKLDGVNLIPYLTGTNTGPPHETLYWRWIAQAAVRQGRWKYLRGGSREYLFDLDADREEKYDLFKEHPDVAVMLKEKLANWSRELQPPGLETQRMSATWEAYYDFYLDGKPISPAGSVSKAPGTTVPDDGQSVQGWKARNCTLRATDDGLASRTTGNSQRPFIAFTGLDLPPTVTAIVRIRATTADSAGFQWREQGQKDFSTAQSVSFDCERSAEIQEHRIDLSGRDDIIHLRFLLPTGGAVVESLVFQNKAGKTLKAWTFRK